MQLNERGELVVVLGRRQRPTVCLSYILVERREVERLTRKGDLARLHDGRATYIAVAYSRHSMLQVTVIL